MWRLYLAAGKVVRGDGKMDAAKNGGVMTESMLEAGAEVHLPSIQLERQWNSKWLKVQT